MRPLSGLVLISGSGQTDSTTTQFLHLSRLKIPSTGIALNISPMRTEPGSNYEWLRAGDQIFPAHRTPVTHFNSVNGGSIDLTDRREFPTKTARDVAWRRHWSRQNWHE